MKTRSNNQTSVLILYLVFLMFVISSCTNNLNSYTNQFNDNYNNATQGNDIRWYKDSKGHFFTNDVTLAQKEIPFTIIVPTYVPDILGDDYLYEISGPFEDPFYHYVELRIKYVGYDSKIYISEKNWESVMLPNADLEPVYHEINGTKVLQQITGFTTGSGRTEGIVFDWNQNGLTFSVEFYSIDDDEAIKVVESMIKQIKSE